MKKSLFSGGNRDFLRVNTMVLRCLPYKLEFSGLIYTGLPSPTYNTEQERIVTEPTV